MIPQYQTITDKGSGNCMAACLASILEMPLTDVPNFAEHATAVAYWDAFHDWLAGHGMVALRIYLGHMGDEGMIYVEGNIGDQFVILSGRSPRGNNISHAVVGKLSESGWGWDVVHDPHPSGFGLAGPIEYVNILIRKPIIPLELGECYER